MMNKNDFIHRYQQLANQQYKLKCSKYVLIIHTMTNDRNMEDRCYEVGVGIL